MIKVSRRFDKVSGCTWIKYKCPECGSKNLTPMRKRAEGKKSLCLYLCEDCKYQSSIEVVYSFRGKKEAM